MKKIQQWKFDNEKCQQWKFDNENSTMKSLQWKCQQWKTNNEMGNNEKSTMKMVAATFWSTWLERNLFWITLLQGLR